MVMVFIAGLHEPIDRQSMRALVFVTDCDLDRSPAPVVASQIHDVAARFAVAEAAVARGAKVTAVAGATSVDPPSNVKVIEVLSADDMHRAVIRELPKATVFIAAAAVADYAPAQKAAGKIKKDGRDFMILELKKTRDILAEVSKKRRNGMLVIGFAAETHDVIGYARSKMKNKGLDMVVANDITKEGAGFNTDTNIATILTADGESELPLMSKRELADKILDRIVKLRKK